MLTNIFKIGNKWVAEIVSGGVHQKSFPCSTKKEARSWIDEKALDAKFGDSSERLMNAAIIKGLIEYDDGMRFFGSTMSYTHHFKNAVNRGLVTTEKSVTPIGVEWYGRCLKQLSHNRPVFWKDGVGFPLETICNIINIYSTRESLSDPTL